MAKMIKISEEEQKWLEEAQEEDRFGDTLLEMQHKIDHGFGGCCGGHGGHACCGRHHMEEEKNG